MNPAFHRASCGPGSGCCAGIPAQAQSERPSGPEARISQPKRRHRQRFRRIPVATVKCVNRQGSRIDLPFTIEWVVDS